jgi:hypothetical protein
LLVAIDHRLRIQQPGAVSVVPLTQAQIGDATGLSEVHVNRILHGWREQEIVDIRRGMIHIRRPDRLAEIAGLVPEHTRRGILPIASVSNAKLA